MPGGRMTCGLNLMHTDWHQVCLDWKQATGSGLCTLKIPWFDFKHVWLQWLCSLPNVIHRYFPFRDKLTVEDSVILKCSKAVIPPSLQNEYINIMHRGHPGRSYKTESMEYCFLTLYATRHWKWNVTNLCSVCNSIKPHQQTNDSSWKISNLP